MNIAFFVFETRDLNTFPSIANAIKLLSREGHSIDVYLPSAMATDMAFDRCRILIVSDYRPFEYVKETVAKIQSTGVAYDLYMAFYIEGLFIAEILSRDNPVKVPVVYFSMELIYKDYPFRLIKSCMRPSRLVLAFLGMILGGESKIPPGRIRRAGQYALDNFFYSVLALRSWGNLKRTGRELVQLSVVSDEMRAGVLKDEFRFVDRIAFAPAAGYIGFHDEPSSYAHRRFGIPAHKKILLYTGGLERGFDLGLLNISRHLGDEYLLFCNVYSRDGYLHEIMPHYAREIEEGKIFFQLENLDEEKYDELVRSCHVGIAWYSADLEAIPNMYYLGFSSGKLNKFLSCGKPVISRASIYGYREMIEGNGLGRVCVHAGEIPAAVAQMEPGYQGMGQQIKTFYLQHLEYERCFKRVLTELEHLGCR